MAFVDFTAVKEAVAFSDAILFLDLHMKRSGNQFRGPCPSCPTSTDRSLVVTEGKGFYCFSAKKGGDVIALATHVLSQPAKDAALYLAEQAGLVASKPDRSRTVPPEREGEGSALSPLSYLEAEHDMIVALGLDPKWCEANGVGYAPRGVVRGSIAIPFRGERGELLGYFGVQELTYIPPDFTTNVVPFEKKRA